MALAALKLPAALAAVLQAVERAGGRALVVGGAVRDALLGRPPEDWDVEVYGLSETRLAECLAPFGVHRVGARLAVFVAAGAEFALPQGSGQGVDPHLPWAEAARRRDFTVNAMAWDARTETLLDAWGGQEDLRAGRLRMVDARSFADDPLRVLRAARFAGQLGFAIHPLTASRCRRLGPQLGQVAGERVRKEWEAILLRGVDLPRSWDALQETGAIVLFPELRALQGVPQRPDAHPEGDVWIHTGRVLAAAGRLRRGQRERDLVLMLAALLHDLGKAVVTRRDAQGRWRALGHEQNLVPAQSFLDRWFPGPTLMRQVLPLLRWHGAPHALARDDAGTAAYGRLALRVPDRSLLLDLALADAQGAGAEGMPPALHKAREIWSALGVLDALPAPWLRGEDLMALGIPPGPLLGKALQLALELQISGAYADGDAILAVLQRRLAGSSRPDGHAC